MPLRKITPRRQYRHMGIPAMSDSAAVAVVAVDIRKSRGRASRAHQPRDFPSVVWGIMREISGKDGLWYVNGQLARRLARRALRKAAQPYRRKRRGPMRAKGAGKNNVTRRS